MLSTLKSVCNTKSAIGSFNIVDLNMARAIIGAAEELKTPVIIGIAVRHWETAAARILSPALLEASETAAVPVVLHLDHAKPKEMDTIWSALDAGFNSIMIDGSKLPYSQNVDITQKAVKLAADYNASVEAEIGAITGEEGVVRSTQNESETRYTDPEEAARFVSETEVDALAVSIGTAHGLYKEAPNINFELIETLRNELSVPLVMHGGTGLTDETIKRTIQCGIRKINYFSGLIEEATETTVRYVNHEDTPDFIALKQHLYNAWKKHAEERIKVFSLKK